MNQRSVTTMSTTSNGQMSVTDLLAASANAESLGVPVDWKQVAYQIANVANNYIVALEAQVPRDGEGGEPGEEL